MNNKKDIPKKKRGRKPKNIIDTNLSNINISNIYKQSISSNKKKKKSYITFKNNKF